MGRIEHRLELVDQPTKVTLPVSAPQRSQLLSLAEQLFVPELTYEWRWRLYLKCEACSLVNRNGPHRLFQQM